MIPARVEPCFDTRMKISPGRPSSYSPTVTKPLQSATRNSKVRDVRLRGQLLAHAARRTIRSTIRSTTSVAASAAVAGARPRGSFLAVESGWATLQLSR